jgi:hypothetical protein
MPVPTIIDILNRCFQPHLQQMQHGSVDNATAKRLKKFGVWNLIEVGRQIGVNDFSMPRVDQLMNASYCIQRTAVFAIAILLWRKICLEYWFENQHRRSLRHPVTDSWYA